MTAKQDAAAQLVVLGLLSRHHPKMDWVTPLSLHVRGTLPVPIAAIGFDTNALKHLRRDATAANDVLVYIESESIPVVVPGQVSQEFWNNHTAFVTDVEQLVSSLNGVMKKLERFGGTEDPTAKLSKARDDIAAVTAEFEDAQKKTLMAESLGLWEKLLTLSTVPFVSREDFSQIGRARFDTKVPPGFADDRKGANQLGDFFVWADFLYGLAKLRIRTPDARRVIFVTGDKKEDWMSFDTPHPVLLAEMFDLVGHVLQIIEPAEFVKTIRSTT